MILVLLVGCTASTLVKGDAPTSSAVDPPEDTESPDSSTHTGDSGQTGETGDSDVTTVWTLPARPDTDHPLLTDSWRWGGGSGYPDRVDPSWPVVHRVSDLAGLTSALAAANDGEIVYVEESASIDLTGQSLCIPEGVWLASNRGEGDGALLYATAGASTPVLKACGPRVRVTGLRIRGPDPQTCPDEWPNRCPQDVSGDVNCAYCTATAYGIGTLGFESLEVDNNEMSGWTYTAVGVNNAVNADVHHNYIHHDWREGLGYGVVLYGKEPVSALIRWNRFEAVRHAVAGQGYPEESYEARDNLMGTAAIGHIFDMHGENEAAGDGSSAAGNDIRVHQNIVLTEDQYALVVRGKPVTGAWFYDNCLARSSTDAADQRYYYGNFYPDLSPAGVAAPNQYDQYPGDCGTLHWCLADGVTGPLRYGSATGTPVSDLLVGDMNGDGKADVFGSDGKAWRYANPDGGSWSSLATSGMAPSSLALADLDGDGKDDVFYGDGSQWRWSQSGSSSWAVLKSSTYKTLEVGFGDFDGDGAQDIFTTDGSQWSYHPHGSGAPVALAKATSPIHSMAFGDFDGDGIDDVFYADGSRWQWSRSGSSSWADLAVSSETVSTLKFADVDGDRITDVLDISQERILYSSGGRTSWKLLRYQHEGRDEMLLGDFNGDGRADVLTSGCL